MLFVLWKNGETPIAVSGDIFSLPTPRPTDVVTTEESLDAIQKSAEGSQSPRDSSSRAKSPDSQTVRAKAPGSCGYLLYQ